MKKRLIVFLLIIVALAGGIWWLVFRKADQFCVRQGIPRDAVFVVETPSFHSIHEKLHRNKIWASLKEYPYFEAYQVNINRIDSLCLAYPVMRRLLTDRPFAVSCHFIPPAAYDFLYVCDLGKMNVIQTLEGTIKAWVEKGKLTKRGDITEISIEDFKLYYAIKANLLFASFSENLVQVALRECEGAGDKKRQAASGDLTFDLNHRRLEKWLGTILAGPDDATDSSALASTGLSLSLKDKALYFTGMTYPNRNYFSLLSALNLIDGGKSQVKDILGNGVAAYVSVCYPSFQELENILVENYKINNLKKYTEYEQVLKRLGKFLGVDLATLFTSWIGGEIAVIKPAVDKEKRLDNLVLAIRSKDIDLAKDQLAYLTEQIGRKTPVRFRGIEYNGHKISYLSLKGFFNLFLGAWFKKFDKPYYTFLGDYVVFSNSSSTLATMIKDYSLGNTLAADEKYKELMGELGNGNNVYCYINSPEAYKYLYYSLKAGSRTEFIKNKGAFESFESIGFSLVNSGSAFETHVIANHNSNASADYEVRELSRELEDFADLVESGYYQVVIPDSIAVSTRGKYAYSTGKLIFSGRLSNGDPDGIWDIKDARGGLVAQYIYREGKPEGEARFFYPDGVVSAQVEYDAGRIQAYKEFHEDGTLKTELEYSKGVRHGEARFYYTTGHLFGEGKYKKGRRTGTWKYYRVTGELEKKLKF